MGTPKNRSKSDPIITRDDIRAWARANLDDLLDSEQYPPRISYVLLESDRTSARFLVASRMVGHNVMTCKGVVFATIQGTRTKLQRIAQSPILERSDETDDEWMRRLNNAVEDMGISSSYLAQLTTRLGGVRLC